MILARHDKTRYIVFVNFLGITVSRSASLPETGVDARYATEPDSTVPSILSWSMRRSERRTQGAA